MKTEKKEKVRESKAATLNLNLKLGILNNMDQVVDMLEMKEKTIKKNKETKELVDENTADER